MSRLAVATVAVTAVIAAFLAVGWMVYQVGIYFEFEYPYYFTIQQAAHATTPSGKPVSAVVERLFPGQRYHWHTCSYCDLYFELPGVQPMRLDTIDSSGRHTPRFLVALHKSSNTMVVVDSFEKLDLRDLEPPADTSEQRAIRGRAILVPRSWRVSP